MKHKKLLLVFSLFFILLCSLTAISASDLNDTDVIANDAGEEIVSSDGDIENDILTETDSGNTFTDLNTTIADGGIVVLTHDYEFNKSTDEYPFQRGVRTPSNTIIDGNGHYISGDNKNRMFYIENVNNVTLKNIRFISGYSGVMLMVELYTLRILQISL